MMLQRPLSGPGSMNTLSTKVRRRRTTDADWEEHRSEIIRLYIDEKRSREDVIAIMKRENGLDITEKQLKYRIEEKWRIRKNGIRKSHGRTVNSTMTSTVRRCSATRYDACPSIDRTTGEPVCEACAIKNFNASPACGSFEGIHSVEIPNQYYPTIINHQSTNAVTYQSGVSTLILADGNFPSAFELLNPDCDVNGFTSATPSRVPDHLRCMSRHSTPMGIPLGVSGNFPQYDLHLSGSGHVPVESEFSPAETFGIMPYNESWSIYNNKNGDVANRQAGLSALSADVGSRIRSNKPCDTSLKSDTLLSCQSIIGTNSNYIDDLDLQQTTCAESRDYGDEQADQMTGTWCHTQSAQSVYLPSQHVNVQHSMRSIQVSFQEAEQAIFHEIDPERILPPLQTLEKHIVNGLNNTFINTYRRLPRQSTSRLLKELKSDWIRSSINAILARIYQLSAENRLNTPASYSKLINHVTGKNPWFPQQSSRAVSGASQNRHPLVSVAAIEYHTTEATITAELHEPSERGGPHPKDPRIYSVYVSYIPGVESRLPGISITFTKPWSFGTESQILPSLRAFNVVPKSSHIVRLVKANDLDGVRIYLQSGKASLDDISSDGHSLLMYALVSESWDVYKMLVTEGADIQHCTLYSKTYDLITCIWRVWLHYFSPIISSGDSGNYKSQKLIEMIDLAKAHGCELGPGADGLMHPNISFHHLSPKSSGSNGSSSVTANPAKCFMHQVCDIEQRNDQGQSALLFEAMVPGLRALTRLEVFLSLKADCTAVDNYGRGALHSILFLKGSHSSNKSIDDEDWFTNYGLLEDEFRPWTSSRVDYYETAWTTGNDGKSNASYNDDRISMHCNPATHYTVYPKLTALLKAGCDPNLLDNMGLTPSDYAFKNGRWSYWKDALETCGWVYDSHRRVCLR